MGALDLRKLAIKYVYKDSLVLVLIFYFYVFIFISKPFRKSGIMSVWKVLFVFLICVYFVSKFKVNLTKGEVLDR